MLRLELLPTGGFSMKPLKVKLLAGEQKATKELHVQKAVSLGASRAKEQLHQPCGQDAERGEAAQGDEKGAKWIWPSGPWVCVGVFFDGALVGAFGVVNGNQRKFLVWGVPLF